MPETESAPPDFAASLIRIDPLIREVVARRLRRLSDDDRADVEQDIRLHFWSYALPRFDFRRGRLEPFAQAVIDRRINDILNHRRARKRTLKLLPLEPSPDDELCEGGHEI